MKRRMTIKVRITLWYAALMMLIPALLLFLGCQEYLEQGIAMSGGKD